MAQINDFLQSRCFEAIRKYCVANGKTVRYAKGDCFTEEGCVGRYAGFVKSGYFKYCVLTAKSEYAVTGFSFVNECIMDFTQSFVFNKPSKISIVAGCDSEVVQVSLRRLRDYISKNNPDFISHSTAIVMEESYERFLNLYRNSSERYLKLIEKYPDVIESVTLRDIASYLLITPVHLSRIRKKLGR